MTMVETTPTGSAALAETPALERVARRLVWWKSPEEALRNRHRFVAQVMNLGTWEDIQIIKQDLVQAVRSVG